MWKVLVLGTIRLNCDWDYDKLKEMADNHATLRQMLGHGSSWGDNYKYPLQTLRDNVSLLTPEILNKINEIVVKAGHKIVLKKEENLKCRCDSSVVKTNVHYPTDINLLFDAIRKVITLIAFAFELEGIKGWRKYEYNIKAIKRAFRKAQNLKRSTSKKESVKEKRIELIKAAHIAYIGLAESFILRAENSITELEEQNFLFIDLINEIERYIAHSKRQVDQIERRVIKGEKIPHEEKVFSVFEEHTEWISKGKAGVPQELGLRVCILEDQFGFILNHIVMEKITDEKVAFPIVFEAKKAFPNIKSCSFDKGFYNPRNKRFLNFMLDLSILPKKGKLSLKDKEEEEAPDFQEGRRQHSAVESAISALQNHSLDRCPDHGIDGFKRYVSLGVLARNLQILGNILQQKEQKRARRKKFREISKAA